ncbi:MAG: YciI family protein [Candidatus Methylacidiphilales bacterium]|nr:YciI family protein [Candidatus Methylacidiphilales bacterium]
MKHFLVELSYTVPFEKVAEVVAEHRTFLQRGYDAELLLFSGPQNPRTGGIIIARAPSRNQLAEFLAEDPFQRENVASYRIVEFEAVKSQPFMKPWIEGSVDLVAPESKPKVAV